MGLQEWRGELGPGPTADLALAHLARAVAMPLDFPGAVRRAAAPPSLLGATGPAGTTPSALDLLITCAA